MKVSCAQIFKIRGLSFNVNINTLGAKERSDAHTPHIGGFPTQTSR